MDYGIPFFPARAIGYMIAQVDSFFHPLRGEKFWNGHIILPKHANVHPQVRGANGKIKTAYPLGRG
jgi:hypothetical protein